MPRSRWMRDNGEFRPNRGRKHADNLPSEDFCILFRTSTQTRVFEECMRKWQIPYRVVGGQNFFDRREVKDILAHLHVLANPSDASPAPSSKNWKAP